MFAGMTAAWTYAPIWNSVSIRTGIDKLNVSAQARANVSSVGSPCGSWKTAVRISTPRGS
jgi:hypothetical protein